MKYYLVVFGVGRWDRQAFTTKKAALKFCKKSGGRIEYGCPSCGFVEVKP